MQVTETSTEGLRREFKVVIDAKDVEALLAARLERLSASARLPGFRPGKVPQSLLRKRYVQTLMGEVLEETVATSSQAALAERKMRVAMQPKVEVQDYREGGDLEYTLAVELMPDFEPADFSKIEVERLVAEPADTDVTAALDRLAKAQSAFAPATDGTAAALGDLVTLDFVGRIDGQEFEGGKTEGARLELGTGQFIPGFEDQLVGAAKGERRTVQATFPADYGMEALAGREAVFDVTVTDVHQPQESKVDDSLAETLGMGTLTELRDAVRKQLQKDFAAVAKRRVKRALLDRLAVLHDFEVPPGLLDAEFESIWRKVKEGRERGEAEPEDEGKSDEELEEQYRSLSERRVRLALLLTEVGRRNRIAVSPQDLDRAIVEHAARYRGQEQAVMDHYRQNAEAAEQLRGPVLEDKVIDYILEIARVSDRTVTPEELLDETGEGTLSARTPDEASKAKAKKRKDRKSK